MGRGTSRAIRSLCRSQDPDIVHGAVHRHELLALLQAEQADMAAFRPRRVAGTVIDLAAQHAALGGSPRWPLNLMGIYAANTRAPGRPLREAIPAAPGRPP
jgi:hypothetical protein